MHQCEHAFLGKSRRGRGEDLDHIPWQAWIKLGLGKMGLPSRDFWALSLLEWILAAEGFAEFHGAGGPDVPTPDEIQAAIEWDEKHNGQRG